MSKGGGETEGFFEAEERVEERSMWNQLTLNYFDTCSYLSI